MSVVKGGIKPPSVGLPTFLPETGLFACLPDFPGVQGLGPDPQASGIDASPSVGLGCGAGSVSSSKALIFIIAFLGVQFVSYTRCSFRAVSEIQGEPLRKAK